MLLVLVKRFPKNKILGVLNGSKDFFNGVSRRVFRVSSQMAEAAKRPMTAP
jgi:hypothetical protein